MADASVRTDDRFHLVVMGALAAGVVIMMGIAQFFLHTPTIRSAALLLLVGMLIAIGYLAIDM